MEGNAPTRLKAWAVPLAALFAFVAGPVNAQLLPWEVTFAEIEAGRLRHLAERLSKQYALYQLRLGETTKEDLVETATQIDRLVESLEVGSPSHSIPAPWTKELTDRVRQVDLAWGPPRKIAVASPYDYIRVSQEFAPRESRRADPLLLRYFDDLSRALIGEVELLIGAYHDECLKTGLAVCPAARTSGYGAMIIERAGKEAVYVIADIDGDANRKRLRETIDAYRALRRANDESPFFAAALDPQRGVSAQAAGDLLSSLREDWDSMQGEFVILAAGDEKNFDLQRMLVVQSRLVEKVERLSAALVRYASAAYGS